MKNLKKLLAVVISLTILLSLAVPAMADTMTDGEKCELLGVLQGTGNGVDSAYLNAATTRAQGATILLRLMGKEDDAKAYLGTDNFKDIVGNEWYAPMLAYLKANPDLGFQGYPDGNFYPDKIMTLAEFIKVLLSALGYKQDVDYEWIDIVDFAEELGINIPSDGNTAMKNSDMAKLIIVALQLNINNQSKTLVDYLIGEGTISAADANAAGLVTALAIVSAVATNSDEITVTFNKSVDASVDAAVWNGSFTVHTTKTWNADRTQVVIKKSSPFTTATYQVVVGEMKADVKVEAPVPTSIVISGPTILRKADAPITVTLYNQYGKKINTSKNDFSITAFNKTAGGTLLVNMGAHTVNTVSVKENEIVTVTVMHNASTIVAQADLTAVDESKVTQFAITEIVNPEKQDKLFTGNKNIVVKYQAYDQYGLPMSVTTKTGLTFVSSDSNVLDVNTIKFDSKGVMTFDAGSKSGTVNLSVLVNSAVSVTTTSVIIYDPSAVNSIIISGPVEGEKGMVVYGETTELQFNIFDQFQSELNAKDNWTTIASSLKWNSTNENVLKNTDFKIDEEGKLTVTPSGSQAGGTAIVYYLWNNELVDSIAFDVNAKAKPVVVDSVTVNGGIEIGATHNLELKHVKVLDQYGRVYDVVNKMTTSDFEIKNNVADSVDYVVCNEISNTLWKLVANTTEGAVDFKISIKGEADSDYLFKVKAIDVAEKDNGVTYKFASFPVLYSNIGFDSVGTAGSYAKAVTLIGTHKDGTVITLLPGKIAFLTSSNKNIIVDTASNKLFANYKDPQTSIVRAYDAQAKLLCEMEVSSSTALSAQNVTFSTTIKEVKASDINGKNIASVYSKFDMKVLDQYGVNMLSTTTPAAFNLMTNGFFTTSDAGIISIAADGTITASESAAEVTLTYTANMGKQASITFKVVAGDA